MTGADAEMIEVKRTLDGRILKYPCRRLVLEPGIRVVVLYEIEAPEVVAGGRVVLPAGARSVGYFWFDRPYVVYHWLRAGTTIVYYVNIGQLRSLSNTEITWDDYAVDVLAFPDGTVDVVDEDEVPDTLDQSIRDFINGGTSRVLADLDVILDSVGRETRSFRLP